MPITDQRDQSTRQVGFKLRRLSTQRKQADYQLQGEVQKTQAKQAILVATVLLKHSKKRTQKI